MNVTNYCVSFEKYLYLYVKLIKEHLTEKYFFFRLYIYTIPVSKQILSQRK